MAEMAFVKSTNSAALVAEAAKRWAFFVLFVAAADRGVLRQEKGDASD
jgi:hypothetical protein